MIFKVPSQLNCSWFYDSKKGLNCQFQNSSEDSREFKIHDADMWLEIMVMLLTKEIPVMLLMCAGLLDIKYCLLKCRNGTHPS